MLPETRNLEVDTVASGTYSSYSGPGSENCPLQMIQNLTDLITSGCAPGNTTFTPALVYEVSTLLRCDLVNTSYPVGLQLYERRTGYPSFSQYDR